MNKVRPKDLKISNGSRQRQRRHKCRTALNDARKDSTISEIMLVDLVSDDEELEATTADNGRDSGDESDQSIVIVFDGKVGVQTKSADSNVSPSQEDGNINEAQTMMIIDNGEDDATAIPSQQTVAEVEVMPSSPPPSPLSPNDIVRSIVSKVIQDREEEIPNAFLKNLQNLRNNVQRYIDFKQDTTTAKPNLADEIYAATLKGTVKR